MYSLIPWKTPATIHHLQKFTWPVILGLNFSHDYLIWFDWFFSNQLHLHQGPMSIVTLDPAPFPLHVNQTSTLPPLHILIKTVSWVTIPPRPIAIVPTAFNGMPKPDCHYSFLKLLAPHESQQHILAVPVLRTFGKKLSLCLLCAIINTSSDEIVLPKNWHLGEMKVLSSIDDPLKPLVVNEVTDTIDSIHVDAQWTQSDNSSYNQCRPSSNSKPVPKSSILKPGTVQIHIQVLLNDVKIWKENKTELYKMLEKYDAIISKSNNDIGQTDLIKMHIATKPNPAPIAAPLYPLVLKHHDVLKLRN